MDAECSCNYSGWHSYLPWKASSEEPVIGLDSRELYDLSLGCPKIGTAVFMEMDAI